MNSANDMRLFAPAAARNRDPILTVFREVAPSAGLVLEIASGTGEHAAHIAPQFPDLSWQPSDLDPANLASIDAHAAHSGAENIRQALTLDVTAQPWPLTQAAMILNVNMIHISPWECTIALMAGAGTVLEDGGVLYLYGPYRREGAHTAPSNEAFDLSLQSRDRRWGVRDLEQVVEEAGKNDLHLDRVVPMPANNFSVIFRKAR
ncbi:class I SAM-dependent methyltransferase [Aestuariispira ectoiniformans]|uniref:class I SAM-dependent methyltransferase n=1 Tax=Aestuariispira ectoiniformans TaxID=2775080 RepID=UPI00223AE6A0|nr:class I SAM-dependent methyltransferase [Aestuariispira ectoiniformans]